MIANIQGYHVSVVTLVLPAFLPLSSLELEQPLKCHTTPILHHPLQNHCSQFTLALPHRICTTAPGSDQNLWCPCKKEPRAAECQGWVPWCVCQAVCPLPCCINTFPGWWTGCSGSATRDQHPGTHSTAVPGGMPGENSWAGKYENIPSPHNTAQSQ